MELFERIKVIRGGLKQEEFAEKLGVSKVTVGRWERGERVPDARDLFRITTEFSEVNPTWLLTGEGPMMRTDGEMARKEEEIIERQELVSLSNDGFRIIYEPTSLDLFVSIIEVIEGIESRYQVKFDSREKALKILMTYLEFVKDADLEAGTIEIDFRVIQNFIGLLGYYQDNSKIPLKDLDEDKLNSLLETLRGLSKDEELEIDFKQNIHCVKTDEHDPSSKEGSCSE